MMKRALIVFTLIAAVILVTFSSGCNDEPKADGKKEAVLSFHSFDGGGPEYSVKIKNPEVLSYTFEREYSKPNHEELDGAGYDAVFKFKGLKEGETEVTVYSNSPIAGDEEYKYTAKVDKDFNVNIKEKN